MFAGLVAVLLVWVALLPRITPVVESDRGIFVSVAARLLDGDRLYNDVWDNKDPFFYYTVLPGRIFGPVADTMAEMAWLVVACLSISAIVKSETTPVLRLVVAFLATPVILTANAYLPGYTELPGVAVCLAVAALALRRRPFLAGILVGVLIYLKLIYLPVALVLAVSQLVFQRDVRGLARFTGGGLLSAGIGAVTLIAQGEFKAYLHALTMNVQYATGPIVGGPWAALGHLELAMTRSSEIEIATAAVIVVGVVLLAKLKRIELDPAQKQLVWLSALATMSCLAVLAVTGLWEHHALLLHVPALLALSLLATVTGNAVRPQTQDRRMQVKSALLSAAAVVLLIGVPAVPNLVRAWHGLPGVWAKDTGQPPEARALLMLGPGGEYARLGENDDEGHAAGLPSSWDLACPRFHQYPFESTAVLNDVLQCAAQSPVLVVSPSLAPETGWADWNNFVSATEQLIATRYECRRSAQIRVCTSR